MRAEQGVARAKGDDFFWEASLPEKLREGAVGVIPTDTLYGIVASAAHAAAVERVYSARGRDRKKPCIVLISGAEDLSRFGVRLDAAARKFISSAWPGPVSVIFPCEGEGLEHLHRGTGTLAFRVPGDEALRDILRQAGPLVAPSANPEGRPPATSVAEARGYFGDTVDFYVDGGTRSGPPSELFRIDGAKIVKLR